MRKGYTAFVAGCVFLLCSNAAYGQPRRLAQLLEDLVISEIAKDVLLVTHSFPWPANSLLVRLNKLDFIWADTPYTPEAANMVLRWLFVKYGKNIRVTEINTGFHIDNLGGNRELIKSKIPVYGSRLTCELLKTKNNAAMKRMLELLRDPKDKKYYDVYDSFIFYEPTKKFDIRKTQTLRFGTDTVEIFYPGPSHTHDNVVVYFPSRKLLFGGCMVLAPDAETAGFVHDGDLREWPKSLRKVLKRYRDAAVVVPGHGEPGSVRLIEHSIEVLERQEANNK